MVQLLPGMFTNALYLIYALYDYYFSPENENKTYKLCGTLCLKVHSLSTILG